MATSFGLKGHPQANVYKKLFNAGAYNTETSILWDPIHSL